MKYIFRIYKSIFKWVPKSAAFAVCRRLCDAFIPAMVTVISIGMFDSAAKVLTGEKDPGGLYFYAGAYLLVYLINDLLGFASSIIIQGWVYEKATAFFRIELYEKLAKLPLILFENADILNRKERAEKAVNDEALSGVINAALRFLRDGVMVVSISAVLSGYNLWLLPLSFLSVLPYLAARIIRGKEFYYVKRHQAKKTRLLSYLWGLFTTRYFWASISANMSLTEVLP